MNPVLTVPFSSSEKSQIAGVCRDDGVAGVTHKNPAPKTSILAHLELYGINEEVLDTNITLDVTVVGRNKPEESTYWYSGYFFDFVPKKESKKSKKSKKCRGHDGK